jgi:DNA polymerase-3 subunit epsilon
MKLHLKRPIVFFDLETTGIDICKDRIVEVCLLKVFPDGSQAIRTDKVNPTIPIPVESSLIHGIYDSDVADKPTFAQLAKGIHQFINGCDLGGFNLLKFDIPMLAEEFLRCGIDYSVEGIHVVDVCKIFHLMEPRSLSGAYKFYCDKTLANAHSAEADTIATYEVLLAQLERYREHTLPGKDGEPYLPVQNNLEILHKTSFQNQADLAGQLKFDSTGKEVFNFGKHKNKVVAEVLTTEPSYYDWMMKADFPLYTKQVVTKIKMRTLQEKLRN